MCRISRRGPKSSAQKTDFRQHNTPDLYQITIVIKRSAPTGARKYLSENGQQMSDPFSTSSASINWRNASGDLSFRLRIERWIVNRFAIDSEAVQISQERSSPINLSDIAPGDMLRCQMDFQEPLLVRIQHETN
jgi:hypothetical protein